VSSFKWRGQSCVPKNVNPNALKRVSSVRNDNKANMRVKKMMKQNKSAWIKPVFILNGEETWKKDIAQSTSDLLSKHQTSEISKHQIRCWNIRSGNTVTVPISRSWVDQAESRSPNLPQPKQTHLPPGHGLFASYVLLQKEIKCFNYFRKAREVMFSWRRLQIRL